jgi:UDP-glucose 4-epimerase
MRILITGGAGFIGSHVLEHLLHGGHTLCVVDDLSSGRTEHVPRAVPLHMADITDAGVERIIADFAPEAIVHLAAQMDVRASTLDPLFDAKVNVLGTVRLLQAAVQHGVKTFVLASSGGAAYGDAPHIPSTEATPTAPMSPYGASKVCDEVYLEAFCRAHPLRGVALRFGNVYGPRQNSAGEAGVVAIFSGAMLAGRAPVIFGDGLQTRDYVYVGDVAQAVACALVTDSARGAVNIGTGVGTPLTDVAQSLRKLTGYTGPILHAPPRAQEVRHSALESSHAQAIMGWSAQTSLSEGLQRTVDQLQAAGPTPAAAPRQSTVPPTAGRHDV